MTKKGPNGETGNFFAVDRRADDADEDDRMACFGSAGTILRLASLTWLAVLEEPIERPGS